MRRENSNKTGDYVSLEHGTRPLQCARAVQKDAVPRKGFVAAGGGPVARPSVLEYASCRFAGLKSGSLALLVADYLDAAEESLRVETIAARRRELEAFLDWVGRDVRIRDVTRRTAVDYVAGVLAKNSNACKTNEDKIGHLNAFWTDAIRRGFGHENPWTGHALIAAGLAGSEVPANRRSWTQAELATVFSQKSERRNVWLAGILALYTGARLGELCNLRLWHVQLQSRTLYIYDARTQLPVRTIPVHPVVYPLIRNQCAKPPDDYLIHDEPALPGGDNRSRHLSRRFTNWLRHDCGIPDKGVVFQSLRNTFIDAAYRAGIQEPLVKLLVARRGFPASRQFNSTATQMVLEGAVARISYGEIDEIVRKLSVCTL